MAAGSSSSTSAQLESSALIARLSIPTDYLLLPESLGGDKEKWGETNCCLEEGWLAEPCCDIWQPIFYKAFWASEEGLEFFGAFRDVHPWNKGFLNIRWGSRYLGRGTWLCNCLLEMQLQCHVRELIFLIWRALSPFTQHRHQTGQQPASFLVLQPQKEAQWYTGRKQ